MALASALCPRSGAGERYIAPGSAPGALGLSGRACGLAGEGRNSPLLHGTYIRVGDSEVFTQIPVHETVTGKCSR